jgi:hypothetical protein
MTGAYLEYLAQRFHRPYFICCEDDDPEEDITLEEERISNFVGLPEKIA